MAPLPPLPAGGCTLPGPRGFTIVEVVVALVLLASGALAVVAATAGALRAVRSADIERGAVVSARNRLEMLASIGCAQLDGGAAVDSTGQVGETWYVAAGHSGLRLATDRVRYADRGSQRTVILHRVIVC